MLDPAEDERVGPLSLASVRTVLLDRPIDENVVEPDDGLEFVLKVERSATGWVPGEGAKDLVVCVLREPPPALMGERIGHRRLAEAPVCNGEGALNRCTATSLNSRCMYRRLTRG
jgi:hypothetical protein